MAINFLNTINFNSIPGLNFVLQQGTVFPTGSSVIEGYLFYRTDTNVIYVNDGSTWLPVGDITNVIGDVTSNISVSVDGNGVATVSQGAASGSVNGYMTSAQYTLLANATDANTPSTLVYRDTNGDFAANDITANKVTGLVAPVAASDAVNKAYVDGFTQGVSWKNAVVTSDADLSTATISFSTGTLTITGLSAGASLGLLDGVETVVGNRVLISDAANAGTGANAAYNGIWVITGGTTTSLTMTRATDMDVASEFSGAAVFVQQGSTNGDQAFVQTEEVTTVNTSAVSFTQITGISNTNAGNGLTKTGNTLDVGAGPGINVTANAVETAAYVPFAYEATGTIGGITGVFTMTITLPDSIDYANVTVYDTATGLQVFAEVDRVSGTVYDVSLSPSILADYNLKVVITGAPTPKTTTVS